jgi:hypothetical protein
VEIHFGYYALHTRASGMHRCFDCLGSMHVLILIQHEYDGYDKHTKVKTKDIPHLESLPVALFYPP